jgi:hypothetical protein
MNILKLINRRIRHQAGGVDAVGDINAVVSANVGERGRSRTHVSSRQRIVQRSGTRHETRAEKETDGTGAERET